MMFNNLIESSSHRKEFKRRGSFLLFTTGTYVLVFVITGVASIYAYDANLGEPSYEINWLPPVNLEASTPVHRDSTPHVRQNPENASQVPTRAVAMLDVNRPDKPPVGVSATPNTNLPLPHGPVVIGPPDSNPIGGGSGGSGSDGGGITPPSRTVMIDAGDPPPAPAPSPAPPRVLKVSKVLNGQAQYLPKPLYPAMARQAHIQGAVNVQVLIDETGKVVSAKVVSGHPLLVMEAQRAAMLARFSPTLIGETPVKISGVIVYNFVMQ